MNKMKWLTKTLSTTSKNERLVDNRLLTCKRVLTEEDKVAIKFLQISF